MGCFNVTLSTCVVICSTRPVASLKRAGGHRCQARGHRIRDSRGVVNEVLGRIRGGGSRRKVLGIRGGVVGEVSGIRGGVGVVSEVLGRIRGGVVGEVLGIRGGVVGGEGALGGRHSAHGRIQEFILGGAKPCSQIQS